MPKTGTSIDETHPAYSFACPFCGADPGIPCRTRRGRGHEVDSPHSRRIDAARIAEEGVTPTVRVKALCCVCGELRTVSEAHHAGTDDPNHSWTNRRKGWVDTLSLKCGQCGQLTRHARLERENSPYRDVVEHQQLVGLGDPDTSRYGRYADLAAVRRHYREDVDLPRNPNLRHRHNVESATEAWDAGKRVHVALCGEPDTINSDPRKWEPSKKRAKRKEQYGGYNVAEQLSDIEYTDLETGLEWIDMDCVDCCRVSNRGLREMKAEWISKCCTWLVAAAANDRIDPDTLDELDGVFLEISRRDKWSKK